MGLTEGLGRESQPSKEAKPDGPLATSGTKWAGRDGNNKRAAHALSHNFMQPEKSSASREQHSNFRTRRAGKLRSLQFASDMSRLRRTRSADWHGRGGVARAGLRFDKIQCLLNQESMTVAESKEESPNRLSAPRGGMQPWQPGVVPCETLSVRPWRALPLFCPANNVAHE